MMAPFDQQGGPQQGPPQVASHMQRPPPHMPHGHNPGMPQGMPPGHHQPMNPPPHYRGSMPGQPHYMPQSPANHAPPNGYGQYSSHPPLHSPPQGGPPHMPPHMAHPQQMQRTNSMGGGHPGMRVMPPPHMPQHDSMRNNSQGGHNRSQPYSSATGNSSSSGGPGGSWQSEKDTQYRREMIHHIVKLLRKDKNGSPESNAKLAQMAKQLEVSLYRNARSFEAYMDMSTLKQRLQQIAVEVSRKARGQGDAPKREDQQFNDRQPSSFNGQNSMRAEKDELGRATSPFMGGSANGNRMVNMDEINPMASKTSGNDSMRQSSATNYSQAPMNDRSSTSQRTNSNSTAGGTGLSATLAGNRNDPEWKMRIRHKQQRLLLLHHSAKCQAEEGRCTVTPHCADMKRLWRHMEGCKDNNCRIPHCFSSRAILSHYRKCKDPACPACGPVRETVRKARTSPALSRPGSGSLLMPDMHGMPPPSTGQQGMPQAQSSSFPNGSYPGATASAPSSSATYQKPRHPVMPPPQKSQSSGQYQSSSQYRADDSLVDDATLQSQMFGSEKPLEESEVTPADELSSSRSVGSQPRNDSEWQKIRHKQQRLLLLRHASRCQYEAGKCPVTAHCASMKKLWEHIAHCKNQQCSVQHCLSSRYVLSHYRRCKDPNCPACGPVRESIRKSNEREKLRQQKGESSIGSDSFMGQGDQLMLDSELPTSDSYQPETKRVKTEHSYPAPTSQHQSHGETIPQPIQKYPSTADGKKSADSSNIDYSLIESFTVKQLEIHLKSLERKSQLPLPKLKAKCQDLLKGLMTHHHGWVFNVPVDPVELGLPDYFELIKKPMDLGSIQKKLENGGYHSLEEFKADVNLTFDNATSYNEEGSVVYNMATELKMKFVADLKKLMIELEAEDRERRRNDKACVLCGCEKLLFEPPVYFCNGMNCQSQRIRRNSHFYVGGNGQYFWCSSCYNELDDSLPIDLIDMTIMKSDLRKKKNDEVHEESWVQCDTCERWVHQICGLFNTRQNKDHQSEYCCPACLLKKRKKSDVPSTRPAGAVDLPRTMLSEWLEQHIYKRIDKKKRELAEDRAQSENISIGDAMRYVESGGPIIIRQVTAMDKKVDVRELMQKRYAHKNYPAEFPYRSKCILVFQQIDGVDVILFALYVYEHGADNPPPNQRTVYISYLDSVHFMRPRRLRTFVYHEILIAYLDYVRRRGFATAHIWACPPLKGDDYIFYAKPEDQKTPRDARLKQWYIDMLIECQKRNIVGKVTNMYDIYFADESLDATAVPYLEGDYFPGEAENIIKMIEDGAVKKGGGKGKKKSKGNAIKSKAGTGTRSTGMDEEALIASGAYEGVRNFKDLDRDQVMLKLGETIQPMKESFIVAFLNWSGAQDEDMVVPQAIEQARLEYAEKGDEHVGSKRDAIGNIRDAILKADDDGNNVKIIDDDEEDLDCEFLNNRQAFLNLCRGNHYQFDELRRAKHTSMMLLWHLHNRDAAKFVQQCVVCSREILSGKRYHCNTCQDYDLCQECYRDPKTNRGACNHELVPIAVEPESQDSSRTSEQERQNRQRNLMLHIQLIEHASRCNSKSCTSSNCAKMKQYLQHAKGCRQKVQGGCRICKRIWTLLRIHAQKCRDPKCPIPQCIAIREKMRQLQKQQQAMDDRRRMEMNRHMRFSMAGGTNH